MPEKSCFACHQAIRDQYILQIGTDRWHEQCIKCHVCRTSLRDSCYRRDGKLFCKDDYQRLFGIKCSVCNQHVPSQELVMRVLGNIYHIRCFLCSICSHPLQKGDQFIIRNGRLICSMDFERETMSYQQCMSQFCQPTGLDELAGDENILMITHPHGPNETARRGPKRPRTILTSHQRRAFKSSFEVSPKPCRKVRESLANDLGLSVRVVQVWFQNQRAKIKKLQRRQQQTEQKQSCKSSDPDKETVDSDDDSSPDDTDDDEKSTGTTDNVLEFPPTKKSTKKESAAISNATLRKGSKVDVQPDEVLCEGNDEIALIRSAGLNVNPYSLDSMTSFSLSPEDSACDLSRSGSLHDISNDAKSVSGKSKFGAHMSGEGTRMNPIDGLYSMQASYFDV